MRILIIHGPNLNLLGSRQPEIYGTKGFDNTFEHLKTLFPNTALSYIQSNIEGELIDKVQQADGKFDGIILNAGGYSHTSVALADAVAAIKTPVIGIHISNIYKREPERHTDLLSKYCVGTITGLGLKGYELAIRYYIEK
ncbi:MAG: 3-dehydroquinate dehydratase [Bacteroidia bacterium]|nr:3-dehydroquinate dehydratase [Bacteroidia bacterium]